MNHRLLNLLLAATTLVAFFMVLTHTWSPQ